MKRGRGLVVVAVVLWAAVLIGATQLDARVAQWVHDARPVDPRHWATRAASWPGVFWFTLLVAAVAAWAKRRWQAGAFVAGAGAISGLNWLMKWTIGRPRPFKAAGNQLAPFDLQPFKEGIVGLFNQRNLAFPSGHTTLAFATAMAMGMLFPRWRWPFFLVALGVAAQRILVNAHYVSDTVGAAAGGILSGYVAWRILQSLEQRGTAEQHGLPVVVKEVEASATVPDAGHGSTEGSHD